MRTSTASRPPFSPFALLLFVAALLLGFTGAAQPSFDCSQASSWAEHAICNAPQLAFFDLEIAASYERLRAALPAEEFAALRDDQRTWLVERDTCEAESDALACLREALEFRALSLAARLIVTAPPDCAATLAVDGETFALRYGLSNQSLMAALYHWAACRHQQTDRDLAAAGLPTADRAAFTQIRDALTQLDDAWSAIEELATGGGSMFQLFTADRVRATATFLAELAVLLPERQAPRARQPLDELTEIDHLQMLLAAKARYLHGPDFLLLFEETPETRTQWRDAQAAHQAALEQIARRTEGHDDAFTVTLLRYLNSTLERRLELLRELEQETGTLRVPPPFVHSSVPSPSHSATTGRP